MVRPVQRLAHFLVALALVFTASNASAQERRVDLRFQGGADVGVPVFLNVDRSIVKPGASLKGWGGFDIGWVVISMGMGFMWNPIQTDNIPGVIRPAGREPLVRLHFSPGVRIQVPLIDSVLPYVTGDFDANFWKFQAFGSQCGWYYCRDDGDAKFAPGFTSKAGVGIRLKGNVYLDVGFQFSLSGQGNFFERRQYWMQPFVGFIYRGDTDRFDGTGY